MKPETYCNAISDGGEEEWDFAWKRSGEISSRNVFFKRCPQEMLLKILTMYTILIQVHCQHCCLREIHPS